jgi:hypothetical protein
MPGDMLIRRADIVLGDEIRYQVIGDDEQRRQGAKHLYKAQLSTHHNTPSKRRAKPQAITVARVDPPVGATLPSFCCSPNRSTAELRLKRDAGLPRGAG